MKKDNHLKFDIGDPVAKFLYEKMQLSPLRFAIIWTMVVVALSFLTAILTHTLFTSALGQGLMNDWVWWVWSLLFTPVIAGYYLWSSCAIDGVVFGLEESEILSILEEDKNAVMSYFKNPWWKILAIFMMVVIGVLYFQTREALAGFASTSIAAKLVTSFTYSILAYFATMLIVNLIINYWAIRRIVQDKELNINPLHPDRCGGLKILSDYSIKVVYLNAIFGILVSISAYRLVSIGSIWASIFLVILYLSVATISFFAPLSTAHEEMQEAKTKLLLNLGKQFWNEYLAAHKAVSDSEALKDEITKIKQLRELYDLTQDFPVWPFDTTTLRRFFITISSPLIPAIIGLLIETVSNRIFLR